jgi:pilus assembly protein Flp/PilA
MIKQMKAFLQDEEGATAIEYGLLAGLIGILIIGGATIIGTQLDRIFDFIATKLTAIPTV